MKRANKTGKTKINHNTNCRHTLTFDGSNMNKWYIAWFCGPKSKDHIAY